MTRRKAATGLASGGNPCDSWELLKAVTFDIIVDLCVEVLTCQGYGGDCSEYETLLADAKALMAEILADAKADGCDLDYTDPCPNA